MPRRYKVRGMVTLDVAAIQDAVKEGIGLGFCLTCGHYQKIVDNDMRNVHCEQCENPTVMGAKHLLKLC